VEKTRPFGRATVTREEKDQAVESVLARYEHLGATIASDNHSLCQLLETLRLTVDAKNVSEYLCSFLTA
jgi:hypothetical protein